MVEAGRKSQAIRLRLFLPLATLVVITLVTVVYALIGGRPKPVIKLHGGQWVSLWVNNAIAKFIIEEGYGYSVETLESTSLTMQTSMSKGEIDLNMEMWQQNWIDWYNEQIEQGNIVNLGMTFEAGPQFFIIPKWVAEQYNIKTVFDMKDHWELFKDPEDPTKGVAFRL